MITPASPSSANSSIDPMESSSLNDESLFNYTSTIAENGFSQETATSVNNPEIDKEEKKETLVKKEALEKILPLVARQEESDR